MLLAIPPSLAALNAEPVSIVTLSGRADLVSGGSALVEIKLPTNAARPKLRVLLGEKDVTGTFETLPDGRTLGLVEGLADGQNLLKAVATDGSFTGAGLTLVNHPIGGPVLLPAQITPWVCATPSATEGDAQTPATIASGLSTPAHDAQCNIETETHYFYRTLAPAAEGEGEGAGCRMTLPDPSEGAGRRMQMSERSCFRPYVPGSTPASAIAQTTPQGAAHPIPYIVRVERGTLNRGIFDIAVLFDPSRPWSALHPQPQWSGKVVYSFGAGTGQPRLQHRSEQNWADDAALSRGFMVVDNSLTDSAFNANRLLSAETLMMMKEYVIKHYGEVRYVMGNGCSGGAIIQNTTASMLPGALDGIQIQCNVVDGTSNRQEVDDCVLLVRAYDGPQWSAVMHQEGLSQAQIDTKKTAINGHLDQRACHSWYNSFAYSNKPGNYTRDMVLDATGRLGPKPGTANNCRLPATWVYDAVRNPKGARCTETDWSVALWGTTPGTLKARQSFDNVGVQYGLKALLDGAITPEEFVTLNETVGGTDADANPTPSRSIADPAALKIAYQTGIVANGGPLSQVPIIDLRGYDETGIHYIWKTFAERDRLDAEGGGHANQLIWRFGPKMRAPQKLTIQSFLAMDEWLSALTVSAPKARPDSIRTAAQVAAAKPAGLSDLCFLGDDSSYSHPVVDPKACDADPYLAVHAYPRMIAGEPRAGNVLKCVLKPRRPSDYGAARFTPDQLARLGKVFPDGVCDWSKPGVGWTPIQTPRTYVSGPGGQKLPPEPVSRPL